MAGAARVDAGYIFRERKRAGYAFKKGRYMPGKFFLAIGGMACLQMQISCGGVANDEMKSYACRMKE